MMLISLFTEEVYFGKAKDVVGDLRSKQTTSPSIDGSSRREGTEDADKSGLGIAPLSETNRDRATQREMISSMQR